LAGSLTVVGLIVDFLTVRRVLAQYGMRHVRWFSVRICAAVGERIVTLLFDPQEPLYKAAPDRSRSSSSNCLFVPDKARI
jgi:hypothetical protein